MQYEDLKKAIAIIQKKRDRFNDQTETDTQAALEKKLALWGIPYTSETLYRNGTEFGNHWGEFRFFVKQRDAYSLHVRHELATTSLNYEYRNAHSKLTDQENRQWQFWNQLQELKNRANSLKNTPPPNTEEVLIDALRELVREELDGYDWS